MSDHFEDRQIELVRDHLAWTTLHHFLPADIVRELAIATLEAIRPDLTLAALFEESLSQGASLQATWTLAPRSVGDADLSYFQDHIRALAWGNDSDIGPRPSSSKSASRPALEALAAARRLGQFDLGVKSAFIERLPLTEGSSGRVLAAAIAAAVDAYNAGDEAGWVAATDAAEALPLPLSALGLKHLGDLCADADLWARALSFYDRARERIDAFGPKWGNFGILFHDIVIQSRANALWSLEGAGAAIEDLNKLAGCSSNRSTRLGVLNASHDALVAQLAVRDYSGLTDLRPTVMAPPLLIQSWDIGNATQNWIRGATDAAHRQFWSVLRRQTALGSVAEAKETKAVYGRALIGESAEGPNAKFDPSAFELGVRLLIESGSAKAAAALDLSTASTRRYLTPAFITRLADQVDNNPGSKDERTLVQFELIAGWTAALDADQGELAELMLRQIVDRVRGGTANIDASINIAGRGLKILSDLAIKAPGFRSRVSGVVVDLIVEQLEGDGFWKAQEDALILARNYIDVLSPRDLHRVLRPVASLLGQGEERRQIFVVRAALNFLMMPRAVEAAANDPELGSRFFREILRANFEQGGEDITTLFNLAAFGPAMELTAEDAEMLSSVVHTVGEQASSLNASSAIDAIHALFSAASHSGAVGVDLAIESLISLLTNRSRNTPPGFPYAYGPILDLLQHGDAIRAGAGWSQTEFQMRLDRVSEALALAWGWIAEEPRRLAAFSIPPSKTPEPSLVNNWAWVTLEAIKTAHNSSALNAALVRAETVPELSHRIQLVRATSAPRFDGNEMDSAFRKEPTDVFYQALGHRLNLVREYEADEARNILEALLAEVLRRGPRELDLAVFVIAPESDLGKNDLQARLKNYQARLRSNASLQRILGPAAARLQASLLAHEDDERA